MVLVHDAPLPVDLLQAHGEPEIQIYGRTAAQIEARADGGSKSDIRASRHGNVPEIELDRIRLHS